MLRIGGVSFQSGICPGRVALNGDVTPRRGMANIAASVGLIVSGVRPDQGTRGCGHRDAEHAGGIGFRNSLGQ